MFKRRLGDAEGGLRNLENAERGWTAIFGEEYWKVAACRVERARCLMGLERRGEAASLLAGAQAAVQREGMPRAFLATYQEARAELQARSATHDVAAKSPSSATVTYRAA